MRNLCAEWCIDALENYASIGSDNRLSPTQVQATTRSNVDILFNGPLGTNFSEIWIRVKIFLLMEIDINTSSAKWQPLCRFPNELILCLTLSLGRCTYSRRNLSNGSELYKEPILSLVRIRLENHCCFIPSGVQELWLHITAEYSNRWSTGCCPIIDGETVRGTWRAGFQSKTPDLKFDHL